MQRTKIFFITFSFLLIVIFSGVLFFVFFTRTNTPPEGFTSQSSSAPLIITSRAVYTDFTTKALRTGKPAVLFFASPKDPYSVQHDAFLRQLSASGSLMVSTYRVAYETATGARFDFAVIVPDTFVLLNARGERQASFVHPTSAEMYKFLTNP